MKPQLGGLQPTNVNLCCTCTHPAQHLSAQHVKHDTAKMQTYHLGKPKGGAYTPCVHVPYNDTYTYQQTVLLPAFQSSDWAV